MTARLVTFIEWTSIVGIVVLGFLLVGICKAEPKAMPLAGASAKNPCDTALDNIGAVDMTVQGAIDHFKANPKSHSAQRLAVMQAATGKGYLIAMRVLLPLACQGDTLNAVDSAVEKRIEELDDFMHGNW